MTTMVVPIFSPESQGEVTEKFQQFITWAQPFGTAGISDLHSAPYNAQDPWFSWGTRLLPHGQKHSKTWLVRWEYFGRDREIFGRSRAGKPPLILQPDALISGSFVAFSKAYLNVITLYKGIRSPSKALPVALMLIEYSLRRLYQGNNNPINLNRQVILQADLELQNSSLRGSLKYEVGREIEIFAHMLQSGYHSKSLRFDGKGFRLIEERFAYTTCQKMVRHIRTGALDKPLNEEGEQRLSGETVAAVGLAYRQAMRRFGRDHRVTFMAAVAAFPLTTVSMRMSDYLGLRYDCLMLDEVTEKLKISIYRPKPDSYQDLFIPRKLAPIVLELFESITSFTSEVREAFSFYIERFGEDFESIDELYVPERFRALLEKPFAPVNIMPSIWYAENAEEHTINSTTPWTQIGLDKFVLGVDEAQDIYLPSPLGGDSTYLRLSEARRRCLTLGIVLPVPEAHDDLFISAYVANRSINRGKEKTLTPLMREIWSEGRNATAYFSTDSLKLCLLAKFKQHKFPHWPFTAKDRKLRLDHALLLQFGKRASHGSASDSKTSRWWSPRQMVAGSIDNWISQYHAGPPLLFSSLGITLNSGKSPSFTLHDLRKYHHTEALLAGISEPFIDELAGRHSGRQSGYYDLRTPHEVVAGSMEVFDPNQDFSVHGPIAEQMPHDISITQRAVFLYENAAPKQITEVGGCSTDWSLNPCEQFGDCMRCNKSLWRKGDMKRLPRIRALHEHARSMLLIGQKKIIPGQEQSPLMRHIQQHQDTIDRCEEIFAVEANPDIEIGTIITFNSAPSAMSTADLVVKLREEGDDV